MRRIVMTALGCVCLTLGGMAPGATAAFAATAADDPAAAPALPPPALPPVDRGLLPEPPRFESLEDRSKLKLFATGAGAMVGIVVVDAASGGLLLAPLGLPSLGGAFSAAGATAAAAPEVAYTLSQRALAAVATVAVALGGAYLGPTLLGVDAPAHP